MNRLIGIVLVALTFSVARADIIWGIDEDGWQFGSTGTVGLLIDPLGVRYEYPDRRAFLSRSREQICVRWNDFHEECVPFGETDCQRGITNFDIDPFLVGLLSGVPDDCGGFVYTSADIDRFVELLLGQ